MAESNDNENGVANANANAATDQQSQSPGMLSKISNTFQAIKMPWNKDEQAAAAAAGGGPTTPSIAGDLPPNGESNGSPPPDGQSSVFSATMSKVSNTFSNIQMPWNKDQQAGLVQAQPTQSVPPSDAEILAGSSGSGSPPADGSGISGAFSKVTSTLSNIQMPWNNKGELKADGSLQEPPPDAAAAAAAGNTTGTGAAGERGVLTNTLSKVSNTFSNMQMPWTSKPGEAGGNPQGSPPPDSGSGSGSQPNANANGTAANNATGATESSPLNKVTGFFSSVFRQGSASQQSDPTAEASATTTASGETSQKTE